MDNRVYYGQYSLNHWLELILKGNILLPDYQRHFVWDEKKVKTLIKTFKDKEFVPPITIGAFKVNENTNQNLILDGQQRLTSVLLAYLGRFPNKESFRATIERMANENDDELEEEEEVAFEYVLKWNFKMLTQEGRSREAILGNITVANYREVDFGIDEQFLKNTFLGFSYLVPHTPDKHKQLRYYSSVFRNINIQGEPLLAQESRQSLYFLGEDLDKFFNPDFSNTLVVKNLNTESKADFVRFASLLSHYAKDGNSNRVARGYKLKMEKYYEDYIYSVVGDQSSEYFKDFSLIFPNREYKARLERLQQTIDGLGIPKVYNSIIEIDTYLFGLIYMVVFENKTIDLTKAADIRTEVEAQIVLYKADAGHRKGPASLKYLKPRIDASIEIYKKYINE